MSDIGESNQRQSDFYWGWNDGEEGRAPRCEREAYLRGWHAATGRLLQEMSDDEPFANYSDATQGE